MAGARRGDGGAGAGVIGAVTIVGGAGAFGRAMAQRLRDEGCRVTSIDVRRDAAAPDDGAIVGDVTAPDAAVCAALAAAECVLLCVPESVALAAVPTLAATVRPNTLVVDWLSIKSHFLGRAAAANPAVDWLGVNPLFGPDLDFAGRPVAVVGRSGGSRSEQFLRVLRGWGGILVDVTPEQHDEAMGRVQALTHAALLAFGVALAEFDTAATPPGLATPLHCVLLALLARMTGGVAVYREIQCSNPYAPRARAALARAVGRLDAAVATADGAPFEQLVREIRDSLGVELPALRRHARALLDAESISAAAASSH